MRPKYGPSTTRRRPTAQGRDRCARAGPRACIRVDSSIDRVASPGWRLLRAPSRGWVGMEILRAPFGPWPTETFETPVYEALVAEWRDSGREVPRSVDRCHDRPARHARLPGAAPAPAAPEDADEAASEAAHTGRRRHPPTRPAPTPPTRPTDAVPARHTPRPTVRPRRLAFARSAAPRKSFSRRPDTTFDRRPATRAAHNAGVSCGRSAARARVPSCRAYAGRRRFRSAREAPRHPVWTAAPPGVGPSRPKSW